MVGWTAFDEYVAWYAWARITWAGDNLACHAAATTATQTLTASDDREAAARAARHAGNSIAARFQIRSCLGPSHRYVEWFLWAGDVLRLPAERCHEAAALAMRTLEAGGTSDEAAEAAMRLTLPPAAQATVTTPDHQSKRQRPVAAARMATKSASVSAPASLAAPAKATSLPSPRLGRAARLTIGVIVILAAGGAAAVFLTGQAWWLVAAFDTVGFFLFIAGMGSPEDLPWLGDSWMRHGTVALSGVALGLGLVTLGTFSPARANARLGTEAAYIVIGCLAVIIGAHLIGDPIRHRLSTAPGRDGTSPADLAHIIQKLPIYLCGIFIGLAIGVVVVFYVFQLRVSLPDPGPYVGT